MTLGGWTSCRRKVTAFSEADRLGWIDKWGKGEGRKELKKAIQQSMKQDGRQFFVSLFAQCGHCAAAAKRRRRSEAKRWDRENKHRQTWLWLKQWTTATGVEALVARLTPLSATSDINHPLAAATGRAQQIKKVTRTTTIVMTSLKSGQRVVWHSAGSLEC